MTPEEKLKLFSFSALYRDEFQIGSAWHPPEDADLVLEYLATLSDERAKEFLKFEPLTMLTYAKLITEQVILSRLQLRAARMALKKYAKREK